MNTEQILKIAGEVAERDYKVLQALAVNREIREMTAGERQASIDREVANNLAKKLWGANIIRFVTFAPRMAQFLRAFWSGRRRVVIPCKARVSWNTRRGGPFGTIYTKNYTIALIGPYYVGCGNRYIHCYLHIWPYKHAIALGPAGLLGPCRIAGNCLPLLGILYRFRILQEPPGAKTIQ